MGNPEDPAVKGADKAFEGAWGEPGPGRDVSDEEREGVESTDTEARTPLGVGESSTRSAEEIAEKEDEEGRTTEGTKGRSDRPYGTSEPESATGVDPQGPAAGGPKAPPGDQDG
ncbi:hypothetical protein [Actinomadura sp. HBU206391]|uniref:hypothetical protein n=1 Tax=Actinomadura sp. HBU206391 TaxID=2731692 RepID=UPI0016508DE4|nr:hypothetical protein [Actinomadura sp. HBU206391]MBC6461879.1 hypothetical protein [Actinomadura sp. HBU206391]